MRLPFSSRRAQDGADSSRRSSLSDRSPSTPPPIDANDSSEQLSAVQSNSTSMTTPATSYSSYSSAVDREAKRTGIYKLSVVDNSGTFLPPSPPDSGKESGRRAWSFHRKQNKSRERAASNDGPFIVSRESFEGYRRSFDIGGTSPNLGPISGFANAPRLSLDSSSTRNPSTSSRAESRLRVSSIPKVDESALSETPFEDVKLDDDDKYSRRTILSRFGFGSRVAIRKKDGEELQIFKSEG